MNSEICGQIRETARGFFKRNLRIADLSDDHDVFASGLVNSLMALQLVTFIENAFAVTVEDEDLQLSNFCSIDRIASFVIRKQSTSC